MSIQRRRREIRWRFGMAKSFRRHVATVIFGFLTVVLISVGIVEGNATVMAGIMVVVGLIVLVLVFGVEIDYIKYDGPLGNVEVGMSNREEDPPEE